MSRVHVFRPIMDEAGNLVSSATVQVDAYATPDVATTQTLWASSEISDASQYDNPIAVTNGILDFWLDAPERLTLTVVTPSRPTEVVVVDALPSGDEIVQSSSALTITNTPSVGEVLTGGAVAGEAEWATAPASVLTAEVPGTAYEFSSGSLPSPPITQDSRLSTGGELGYLGDGTGYGAHLTQPVWINEDIVDAPSDPAFTYTKAIRIDGQIGQPTFLNCIRLDVTMADGGRIDMWVRVASSPGSAKTVVAVQPVNPDYFDNHWVRRVAFDPSQDQTWVHLLIEIPDTSDGLVSVFVGETNAQDNDSMSTALAFIQPIAGGVIPPHYHSGTGSNSVEVGTGAAAVGDFSVAVGVNADASTNSSLAVGYDAQAQGSEAVAIGASSRANVDFAQAIGKDADASGIGAIAVGHTSEASGADSAAFGHNARALAADAIAVGADALASGASSTAVGSDSQAGASDSIALGAGAIVDPAHAGSLAIGKNAASTGSGQLAIGATDNLVLIQGTWRNLGDASFGDVDTRLGFFGLAGTTIQEVTGSRDGNVALAALLTALADLGLITDSSVV